MLAIIPGEMLLLPVVPANFVAPAMFLSACLSAFPFCEAASPSEEPVLPEEEPPPEEEPSPEEPFPDSPAELSGIAPLAPAFAVDFTLLMLSE